MLGVGGTHLDSSSRHLSDEDGFGGFSAVGTVADGRLSVNPSHREPVNRVTKFKAPQGPLP